MKVYRKLVLDYDGNVLEEDSYDYAGPVAEAKGGSNVTVPGPTAAQEAASQAQTQMLQQQMSMMQKMQREQNILGPMMYKQAGYNPTFNAQGELTGLDQSPEMAAQMSRQGELTKGFQERQLAAMRGELPVDPGLMIDLQRQDRMNQQSLASQFGQGGGGSTGAMQAQDVFAARKNAILEGARRGDLTLAEQLGASSQMQQTALMQRAMQGAGSGLQMQQGLLGNMFSGVNSAVQAQQPGLAQQQMGLNASMRNAQNQSSMMGGLLSLGGSLGAAAMTGGMSGFGSSALGSLFGK